MTMMLDSDDSSTLEDDVEKRNQLSTRKKKSIQGNVSVHSVHIVCPFFTSQKTPVHHTLDSKVSLKNRQSHQRSYNYTIVVQATLNNQPHQLS